LFKRITWMGIGMAVGATGAFRAKRKVEETIERYLPEQVADRAAASARGVGHVVRSAAQEGREAMRATESELRARVEARTYVGERPVGGAPGAGPAVARPGADATPPGPRRQSRAAAPAGPAATGRRRRRR
jgi:hypothetical protein